MKSVLISIQPKWCELIASGKKTVEVRKTRPKLETPFKVYIYCTSQKVNGEILLTYDKKVEVRNRGFRDEGDIPLAGKVIGEFVCDKIEDFRYDALYMTYMARKYRDAKSVNEEFWEGTQVTYQEAYDYCEGMTFGDLDSEKPTDIFYGWHISNLVIYDKPKELSEFIIPSKIGCCNEGKCRGCQYFDSGNGFNVEDDCKAWFSTDEYKPLRRPPQSWCYVD